MDYQIIMEYQIINWKKTPKSFKRFCQRRSRLIRNSCNGDRDKWAHHRPQVYQLNYRHELSMSGWLLFLFFFTFDQFQRIDRFINWSGIYSLSFFLIFQKRDLEANNLKTIAHGTFRPFGGLTRMQVAPVFCCSSGTVQNRLYRTV